jgi:hypothetical protein
MNPQRTELETALTRAHKSLRGAQCDSCDPDDIEERVERIEQELDARTPNMQVIGTFLNSIARSLRGRPNSDEACSRIDEALRKVGVVRAWTN